MALAGTRTGCWPWPTQSKVSTGLELGPGASLVTRDRPATHAALSHAGNRVEKPAHCSAGGSDTQAYDGAEFSFFFFICLHSAEFRCTA